MTSGGNHLPPPAPSIQLCIPNRSGDHVRSGQTEGTTYMSDTFAEDFNLPRMVDLPDIAGPDTPRWLVRAMDLFADHNLPNDEFDLRGQYTENRMFLRRIEQERIDGKLNLIDMRDMEESFARACADPEGDPMLAVEKVYLEKYYARQPKRRTAPVSAVQP